MDRRALIVEAVRRREDVRRIREVLAAREASVDVLPRRKKRKSNYLGYPQEHAPSFGTITWSTGFRGGLSFNGRRIPLADIWVERTVVRVDRVDARDHTPTKGRALMDWTDPTYTALRAAIFTEDCARQRIVRQLEQAKSAAQTGRYRDVEIALALMETHLTEARQRGTEVALRESAIRRKAAKGRKLAGGAC